MDIDLEKILEASKNLKEATVEESDISKKIMAIAKQVYEEYSQYNSWFRGIDMLEELKDLGKANVRTHLEKLVDRQMLESGLHNNKKVYRIRVIEDE